MKKLLALLLTAMLLISCIPALAQSEVVIWCWDPAFNIYAMNEAAKVYNKDNPDVKITVVEVSSNDCETKQTVALTSGDTSTLPDIILMQDNSGKKFLSTFPGAYTETGDKLDLSQFSQYKVDRFSDNGKAYCVPFDNGVAATFIRTDYLQEAGFTLQDLTDITWERFIEIGQAVKEKTGHFMLSNQTGYADMISMMVESTGTWFFDAEGNPVLDTNPAIKKAVETVVALRKSGIVKEAADWTEYIASFNNGTAAGTIQGCWIIGSVSLVKEQSGKWGVTNIPRLDVEGGTNYGSNGGSSWVIPASAKNKEGAIDFLKKTFGGSVDFYQTILESSGAIATWKQASEGEAYKKEIPFFNNQKVFSDLMDYSAKLPKVQYGIYNYEARDAVMKAAEAVFNGTPIDSALKTAQEEVVFTIGQ